MTYQVGRIFAYTFIEYHPDTAGNPNIKIPDKRYRISNAASNSNTFVKDCEKSIIWRFISKKEMLKILAITPTMETDHIPDKKYNANILSPTKCFEFISYSLVRNTLCDDQN